MITQRPWDVADDDQHLRLLLGRAPALSDEWRPAYLNLIRGGIWHDSHHSTHVAH